MTKRYAVRWFLAGGALARTGDELAGPALLLAGFAVAGSPATGALLLAALTVPAVLGGPLVGVLLDRARRPGRLLAAALLLYALGLGDTERTALEHRLHPVGARRVARSALGEDDAGA
ncbi:hypothetical protein ABZ630_26705, partial [Streptomyces albidoflavus]